MVEYYQFLYVKALGNGSLSVGPNYKILEEQKDREEIIENAHRALTEAYIDVSRIMKNEDYGDPYFYINNRIKDALEILHEVDEEF